MFLHYEQFLVKSQSQNTRNMRQKHLKNFDYDRLFKVDLALIYLALTEIEYCKTPKAVAINEILEMAKKYSTEKSSKFINGLVSAIINQE